MARVYTDDQLTFEVPEFIAKKYKVRVIAAGNYSLEYKNGVISISLLEPSSKERHIQQLQTMAQRDTPGWKCSPVEELQLGNNLCHCQSAQTTDVANSMSELLAVVESPAGCLFVKLVQNRTAVVKDIETLLASLRWSGSRAPAAAPQPSATELRKWKAAKGRALQSARAQPMSAAGPRRLFVVFADNYQFCLYDTTSDPFTPFPQIGDREKCQGWTKTDHAIWYFTVAHGNRHRVDLATSTTVYDDPAAERVAVLNLDVPGGRVAVYDHEQAGEIQVLPGPHTVYLYAYNLGKEDASVSSDAEFLRRTDLERYAIILVPGRAAQEGLLRGFTTS